MNLPHTPFINPKSATSGASSGKNVYSFSNAVLIKHNNLFNYRPWNAGSARAGKIVTLSNGRSTLTSSTSTLNSSYSDTSVSFIGGFVANPYSSTLSSIVFSGSGSVTAIPAVDSHQVLSLTLLSTVLYSKSASLASALMLNKHLSLSSMFFLVLQLPSHSHVSNLEVIPSSGATLASSSGSSAKLINIDPSTSLSLAKLPSGVNNLISIFAIGSLGKPSLSESNNLNITSAASSLIFGNAPSSRGIANNPVDHPHGGRTNAIRYPSTPWGKTTNYK